MIGLWRQIHLIKRSLRHARKVLLLLDFDGTLVPIAKTSHLVKFSPEARDQLSKLSRKRKVTVAVISGRSLKDIKEKVGVKGIIYAGNHGRQWQIGDRSGEVSFKDGVVSDFRSRLLNLERSFPGSLIEDKGVGISFHYRLVVNGKKAELKRQFQKLIIPYLNEGGVTLLKGKEVFDVYPHDSVSKGKFCLTLKARYKRCYGDKLRVIYIGDDVTDETAFSALTDSVTVFVGARKSSKANYNLRSVGGVHRFIAWLRRVI